MSSFHSMTYVKTGRLKRSQFSFLFLSSENLKKMFYFFTYILIDYLVHEITKEFWKNNHFENMTAGFLLSCEKSLRQTTLEITGCPNLYGRMDGSKFTRFPWFPANSLLCIIKRYTVYLHSLGTPNLRVSQAKISKQLLLVLMYLNNNTF